jgi:hypothetical protein
VNFEVVSGGGTVAMSGASDSAGQRQWALSLTLALS